MKALKCLLMIAATLLTTVGATINVYRNHSGASVRNSYGDVHYFVQSEEGDIIEYTSERSGWNTRPVVWANFTTMHSPIAAVAWNELDQVRAPSITSRSGLLIPFADQPLLLLLPKFCLSNYCWQFDVSTVREILGRWLVRWRSE